jgi:peptide/nickel transport system substrate-binding protein
MRLARPSAVLAVSALLGATMLAACAKSSSSSGTASGASGAFGSVPAATGTAHPGTITSAEPPGSAPNWIFPISPSANASVYSSYSFNYELWRPLYWYVNGVAPAQTPAMSLASLPVYSNGDKTVTITMKSTYKWSDGQPVTSKDVLFYIDELKAAVKESPDNWYTYTPGVGLPDQVVSASTPNASTLVLNLNAAVNPMWMTENELGIIQPMPAHAWARASANGPILDFTQPANAKKIYDFLAKASGSLGTYATNPLWQVVDGPYKLTAFNSGTGAFTMAPNPGYGGPHSAQVPTLQAVPFTSDTAEFNAVKAGSIDIGYVPQTDVPQVGDVKAAGYHVFGYPDFGNNFVAYNFKDTTGDFDHIIGQLYVRQAIAHLEDETGYIKAFFHGAGGPAYGPVPALPVSPYTPSDAVTDPYPFSVSAAVSLLKAHGWKVAPGGTDSCARAGSGASECGAGIPAGTKLAFNLIYASTPDITAEMDTDLAAQAKKAGITITLKSDTFNHIISAYNDPGSPKTINDWAAEDYGGDTNSTYPTQFGVFNSTGSFNQGLYSSPEADKLINASVTGGSPSAVKAEAAYLTEQQPALFQPNQDLIVVWKTTVSGSPAAFKALTQYQLNTELMYLTK